MRVLTAHTGMQVLFKNVFTSAPFTRLYYNICIPMCQYAAGLVKFQHTL